MPVVAAPPERGSMKAILMSAFAGAVESAATSNRPGATNALARMAPPSSPARSSRGQKRGRSASAACRSSGASMLPGRMHHFKGYNQAADEPAHDEPDSRRGGDPCKA